MRIENDKSCSNCIYSGRPTYKSPCSECYAIRNIKTNYCKTTADEILLIGKAMEKAELTPLLSAQPEITRCKYCTKHRESGLCERLSTYEAVTTKDDDFCSWAERKEDGSD